MRQLDTCDFCGDAAEGVYEVVSASVAGDSHRLALCADCRTTLQSVVDPLLDAVADDSDSDARGDASDGSDATEGSDAPTAASTVDDGDATAEATSASDATAEATDDSDASGIATSDDADSEGVTIEVGGSEGDGVTEAADGDADAGDGDADDDDAATDGSRARRPSGYAQLVRLLQNRDGAMAREDLRALATNAYDIGSTEFETALEAAVENGDVEETPDGLRTA